MKIPAKPLIITLISVILLTVFCFGYVMNLKSHISDNLLRLHIIGATDNTYDQLMKLCVRDRILTEFSDSFSQCRTANDAAQIAENLKSEIENAAANELSGLGYNAEVVAEVSECDFPTKKYGNIILPRGKYTALNIKIGGAKGRNWWCVMYPPLCISDSSVVMSEASKEKLKHTLSDEEYSLITNGNKPDIKIKFRIAEILGKYFR